MNLYAKYLSILYGLNKNRCLNQTEMALFIKKRQKLIGKYWGAIGNPAINAQIPLTEAVNFIVEAFSKQLPIAGSFALGFLYSSNDRNFAKELGYNYVETYTSMNTFLLNKIKEIGNPYETNEEFISKNTFMFHILHILMTKDQRVQLKISYEKEDKDNSGTIKPDFFKESIKKIMPISLPDADFSRLVKLFLNKDNEFEYKVFFDQLGYIDIGIKSTECQVPFIGVCYAILKGIIGNYEECKENLSVELKKLNCNEHLPKSFREYVFNTKI